MTLVAHMRKRLGMYVPTDSNGCPQPLVWENLLHELVAEGVESFGRGEATHLALSGDGDGVCVEHDGGLRPGGLDRVFELPDGPVDAVGYGWFGGIRLALAAALSERLSIETCEGGECLSVESRHGVAGPVQRLLPGMAVAGRRVRIHAEPERGYLGEEPVEAWAPDELQSLGEALACGHPGLRVTVNGREHFMPKGVEGLVERQMEEAGGKVLAPVEAAPVPGASFAWGAVRRRGAGRRLVGRAFINGREITRKAVLGRLGRMVLAWLGDARRLPDGPCTVFFALGTDVPETAFPRPDYVRWLWNSGPGDWDGPCDDGVPPHFFALAAQCMARAFGRRLA